MLAMTPFRQLARLYGSILSITHSQARSAQAAEEQRQQIAELNTQLSRLGAELASVVRTAAAPAPAPEPIRETAPPHPGPPRLAVDLYERMGLKLLLDYSSIVDRCMIDVGHWEAEQTTYFIGVMARHPEAAFLDLGSYWGLYSLLAMRAGIRTIHAFDADRQNFAQLQSQIFLNSAHAITPHHKAIYSHSMRLHFLDSRSIPDGNRGGCHIVTANYDRPSFEVDAVAIDDYLHFADRTLFIKMDLEGHESPALQGLAQTLARNKVFLQIEMFDQHVADTLPTLTSLGLRKVHEIAPDHYYTNMSDEELRAAG